MDEERIKNLLGDESYSLYRGWLERMESAHQGIPITPDAYMFRCPVCKRLQAHGQPCDDGHLLTAPEHIGVYTAESMDNLRELLNSLAGYLINGTEQDARLGREIRAALFPKVVAKWEDSIVPNR